MERKKGLIEIEDISSNPKVKYGTEAEAPIRELFALDHPELEVQYIEDVTLVSNEYSWKSYSPDGLLLHKDSGLKGIYEGKTVTIENSLQLKEWDNQVPMNYFIQVLHGLNVTKFDFVYLRVLMRWIKEDEAGNRVIESRIKEYTFFASDYKEDLWYLHDQEVAAYQYYIDNVEPPLLLNI